MKNLLKSSIYILIFLSTYLLLLHCIFSAQYTNYSYLFNAGAGEMKLAEEFL